MHPTDKQIAYALHLLGREGYTGKWMNASFKIIGATMRERQGTVEEWLQKMNQAEISALIKRLRKDN